MRTLKLFAFLFALSLFFACSSQSTSESSANQTAPPAAKSIPFQDIGLAAFGEMTKAGDKIILDVRTPGEVAEGVIPGSMHIDIQSADFVNRIEELNKDKEYIVYCKSGGRSARASDMMSKVGFKKVYNLKGGYTAWSAEQ